MCTKVRHIGKKKCYLKNVTILCLKLNKAGEKKSKKSLLYIHISRGPSKKFCSSKKFKDILFGLIYSER